MFVRSLIPYRRCVTPLHRSFRNLDTDLDEFFGATESFLSTAVDVIDNEKNVQVVAELPGLEEKDIEVSIDNDVLTIKGEKKQEKEEKEKDFYRMERSFGTFHRQVALPAKTLDASKCDAAFKNGVLTITIQKKEKAEAKVQKIPVKAG